MSPDHIRLFSRSGGYAFHHRWLDDRGSGRQALADEELVSEGFFGLHAFLHVHVERAVEKVGEIVQVNDAGTTLRDASSGVVYSGLDVTADLLLLFDFAY